MYNIPMNSHLFPFDNFCQRFWHNFMYAWLYYTIYQLLYYSIIIRLGRKTNIVRPGNAWVRKSGPVQSEIQRTLKLLEISLKNTKI